jgi:hypothetical protein
MHLSSREIMPDDYRRLCAVVMSAACTRESEAARHLADLIDALAQVVGTAWTYTLREARNSGASASSVN